MFSCAPRGPGDAGVYVHFPYCTRKCPYCDFNSHAAAFDDRAYADAVIQEIEARGPAHVPLGPAGSVYFGGGTPSLWDPAEIGRVLSAIRAGIGLRDDAEVTLEANPGTVDEGRFERFVESGVNRFSVGAQSFRDQELVTLGRIHGANAARRAVRAAKATGARVSLDLIYGLPGQSRDAALQSVEDAIALEPSHISAYTLTIEPGTALARAEERGRFRPTEDDRMAEHIQDVSERLGRAGFLRYEISSYAPPGQEALHNTLYWFGGPYLGVGAGAHSFLPLSRRLAGAERRESLRNPEAYIADAARGAFTPESIEHLTQADLIADRLWTAMRTRFGLDLEALAEETEDAIAPESMIACLSEALDRLVERGLIVRLGSRGGQIAPTPMGFLYNDEVGRTLLLAARDRLAPLLAARSNHHHGPAPA
ncbi:MAG: radical SAM family heme chaperone HemW [Deltaproteobacteria bacterium]|nr:radical SAM family heme chaperone HemW [Deltaproteobacteria bacterium]